MFRSLSLALVCLLVGGCNCGKPVSGTEDGGEASDGGTGSDAGTGGDAGTLADGGPVTCIP